MKTDSYVFTSTGGRSYNEDAAGARELADGGLFVVADGLGGHLHGEQASACAVDTILGSYDPEADPQEALHACLTRANEAILALQESNRANMKSTAVCLLIREDRAYWAHVGDSRLYHFRNGWMAACTEDHSVAYKKYRMGEITRSQIATDEDQSSLLRALGNPTRSQPELGGAPENLTAGEGFLLCSDGLWEYLHDQEILADLLKTETAKQWAQQLLLRVMERVQDGNDNLTLITVRVR